MEILLFKVSFSFVRLPESALHHRQIHQFVLLNPHNLLFLISAIFDVLPCSLLKDQFNLSNTFTGLCFYPTLSSPLIKIVIRIVTRVDNQSGSENLAISLHAALTLGVFHITNSSSRYDSPTQLFLLLCC